MGVRGLQEVIDGSGEHSKGNMNCLNGFDAPPNHRLVREIGRGGMGVVYEAIELSSGERRAVKLLHVSMLAGEDASERMMREARVGAMLRSQHATRIHAWGRTAGGDPYIVMEYLEGVDLATYLADAGGCLPLAEALDIVCQACEAIGEAHSLGVIHRDLKPANLFVTRTEDERLHARLLDFGLAKLGHAELLTRTCSGVVFGTPQYMSPEQLKSSGDADPRTDVWALGVMLCELVYGAYPFGGRNISQLIASILSAAPELPQRDDVPSELRRIVLKCLSKSPNARYASVLALRDDLERVPNGTTSSRDFSGLTPRPFSFDAQRSRPPSAGSYDAPWSRAEWTAALLACLMMLAAGIMMSAATRPPSPKIVSAASSAPPPDASVPSPTSVDGGAAAMKKDAGAELASRAR